MTRNGPRARVVKRSVTIAGHATSISLEQPFWSGFLHIARSEGLSAAALLRRIDATRGQEDEFHGNLSSAIRVFVLEWVATRAGMELRP